MNELKIKYKANTGNSAFVEIDSVLMTEELDTYPLEECDTANEVIGFINACDNEWSIPMSLIPHQYNDNDDLKIYRPEYVEWLEEKLKSKL